MRNGPPDGGPITLISSSLSDKRQYAGAIVETRTAPITLNFTEVSIEFTGFEVWTLYSNLAAVRELEDAAPMGDGRKFDKAPVIESPGGFVW